MSIHSIHTGGGDVKVQIYLPDELGEQVKAKEELNVSAICQTALAAELDRLDRLAGLSEGFEDVEVETMDEGNYGPTVVFTGRLLATREWGPDRTTDVYLTGRKRIAIVRKDGFGDNVDDFDSIDDAIDDANADDAKYVEMLLSEAAAELGEHRPVRLDI
jgi:post-segregation antitoxin (ccd killing protein)